MRLRRLRILLWLLLPLASLAAAGWIVASYAHELQLLRRARTSLESGRADHALEALEALRRRRFLSLESRRDAAALLFRLGEDRVAHQLLRGQRFRAGDPEDRRLRELSRRCQRATALLAETSASRDPLQRLRLLRAAGAELPESPRVLEQLVREEYLAFAILNDPDLQDQFRKDLAALRGLAPERAERLLEELEAEIPERLQKLGERKQPLRGMSNN